MRESQTHQKFWVRIWSTMPTVTCQIQFQTLVTDVSTFCELEIRVQLDKLGYDSQMEFDTQVTDSPEIRCRKTS